jgi:polyhydroxybutyrate depolymerase
VPSSAVDLEPYELDTVQPVRRYLLVRPTGHDAGSLPVVIDLHGSGLRPEAHITVTDARRFAGLGALVVVPEASIPFRMLDGWPAGWAWNVPGSPLPGESVPRDAPDDVAFLGALIDRLVARHGADPTRIHLRGFSGGARLGAHIAARMPDRVTSICCVAGVRFAGIPAGCLPPLLAVHGALDTVNPYDGGAGPRWSESVEEVVAQWAVGTECHRTPETKLLAEGVRELRYTRDDGPAPVRLITVADAEHSWPGTADGDHLAQFGAAGVFSASQAHWDFLHEIEKSRMST